MADKPALRVIAYDIADDRRRRRVAKILEDAAVRMQESLFEARLTERGLAKLVKALSAAIGEDDSLRIYTVPDAALKRSSAHGGPEIMQGARYWLL